MAYNLSDTNKKESRAKKNSTSPSPERFGRGSQQERLVTQEPNPERFGSVQGPVTPPGVPMPSPSPLFNPLQNAVDTASAFNPLQNAVDTAPMGGLPVFNPLQNAVDSSIQSAPPMVPPGMLGNPLQNAIDSSIQSAPPMVPPGMLGGGGTPTPRPDPTTTSAIPTPTPSPGGGGGFAGPWGANLNEQMSADDPRGVLARAMANERMSAANYTTSAPGWLGGKTSAIFGRGR